MERKPMFDRERMQVLDRWLSGPGAKAATNEFQKFAQAATDFATTAMAFNAAREETADMISATKARLQMELDLAASRVKELEQTANDPERSDTVRRVAAAELEKIRKQRIAATPEEKEATAQLIGQQKTALCDLLDLKQTLREALETFNGSVEEIRAAVLGYDIDHKKVFISGFEEELVNLCEEVPVYDKAGV